MAMTEKLTQPIGGWTAWCLSLRGIPRESRNPVSAQTKPAKAETQEKVHAR